MRRRWFRDVVGLAWRARVAALHIAKSEVESKWEEFLTATFGDASATVNNPNPETRGKYPKVTLGTALRNPAFAAQVQRKFQDWLAQNQEQGNSPSLPDEDEDDASWLDEFKKAPEKQDEDEDDSWLNEFKKAPEKKQEPDGENGDDEDDASWLNEFKEAPEKKAPEKKAPEKGPVNMSRVKVQGWNDETTAMARDWWPDLEHLSDEEMRHEVLRTTGVDPQHLGRVSVETSDGRISLKAKLKGGGTVERSLVSDFDYDEGRLRVSLVAEKFEIPTSEAAREKHGYPKGYGTRAFSRMVDTAARLGVKNIETEAAGKAGDKYNGYATWPALGYDGPISGVTYDMTARRAREQGLSIPPAFKEDALISELYATPEGREFWRRAGININLTFDPSPDSPQRRALDAYRKAKGL